MDGRLRQDLCLRGPEDRAIRVQGEVSVGAVSCSLPWWVPYLCPGGYPAFVLVSTLPMPRYPCPGGWVPYRCPGGYLTHAVVGTLPLSWMVPYLCPDEYLTHALVGTLPYLCPGGTLPT